MFQRVHKTAQPNPAAVQSCSTLPNFTTNRNQENFRIQSLLTSYFIIADDVELLLGGRTEGRMRAELFRQHDGLVHTGRRLEERVDLLPAILE